LNGLAGVAVVCDRYCYSGIAFTMTKPSMAGRERWAEAPDCGLIAPDMVFFLHVSPDVAASRGGYGAERYEKADIQARAGVQFQRLEAAAASSTGFGRGVEWVTINANGPQREVQDVLVASAKALLVAAGAGAPTELTTLAPDTSQESAVRPTPPARMTQAQQHEAAMQYEATLTPAEAHTQSYEDAHEAAMTVGC
jgi:hypothetical protein